EFDTAKPTAVVVLLQQKTKQGAKAKDIHANVTQQELNNVVDPLYLQMSLATTAEVVSDAIQVEVPPSIVAQKVDAAAGKQPVMELIEVDNIQNVDDVAMDLNVPSKALTSFSFAMVDNATKENDAGILEGFPSPSPILDGTPEVIPETQLCQVVVKNDDELEGVAKDDVLIILQAWVDMAEAEKEAVNVMLSDDSGCAIPETTQKVVIVSDEDFDEVVRADLQVFKQWADMDKSEKSFTPVINKNQTKKLKQLARSVWKPYSTHSRGVTSHMSL
ncbi:hypothetical protein A2U01_0016193, partial [Trifolium medium]|nr:hypothetical protein [Trifolium medium]